jgi:hypothetical protein
MPVKMGSHLVHVSWSHLWKAMSFMFETHMMCLIGSCYWYVLLAEATDGTFMMAID